MISSDLATDYADSVLVNESREDFETDDMGSAGSGGPDESGGRWQSSANTSRTLHFSNLVLRASYLSLHYS